MAYASNSEFFSDSNVLMWQLLCRVSMNQKVQSESSLIRNMVGCRQEPNNEKNLYYLLDSEREQCVDVAFNLLRRRGR